MKKGQRTENPLKWCFVCKRNKPRVQFANGKFGRTCSKECGLKSVKIQTLRRRGVPYIRGVIKKHLLAAKEWRELIEQYG